MPKPELLAPAGREEVFHAVLDAGADAVYLSSREFNMRRHRRDFHFSRADLARLTEIAHARQRKLYVTVNILVGEDELPALADYLRFLADLQVDAAIVQDLATVRLTRELGLALPLHASTMMNVATAEHARLLRRWGFTRAVTSRDITLEEARRIKEGSGLEIEFFAHGDLCSVQSGQCHASGILFGKSSNRGQCLKPCRWAYDLLGADGGVVSLQSHLLAARDLCLLQQIPELILAGVDSLKIEGRMKPASILVPIISAYRVALDHACGNPLETRRDATLADDIQRNRVRNLTTGFAFSAPGPEYFDLAGDREPVFLSRYGTLLPLAAAPPEMATPAASAAPPAGISVVAGTPEGARAALDAGADTLILAWEGDLRIDSTWPRYAVEELATRCRAAGRRLALTTPRILGERELRELEQVLDAFPGIDTVCATSPSSLELLRARGRRIWAEPALNVINSEAAAWLAGLGVERIAPSQEASLAELVELRCAHPELELELLAHGPIAGMIVEHCLVAMATQRISKREFCKMPCAQTDFLLRDARGACRPLRSDRYCRNHLILEHELATLPRLPELLALRPTALRLDLRLATPEQTATWIELYRAFLPRAAAAEPGFAEAARAALAAASPGQTFTFGAYGTGICRDEEISRLQIKKEQRHDATGG